jgi:hypothetical protein
MKIDLAIHSSDSNPFYLDFWPLVSKVWALKFKIKPVLVYIDENHDIPISTKYGPVIKLKPIPDVPVYLQCLWVRYWLPSQYPDKISITCDIDMFPISRKYFIDQIKDISDTKYVHLHPNEEMLPTCYHIAKGSLFKEVLSLDSDWATDIRKLNSLNLGGEQPTVDGRGTTNPIMKGKTQWGSDEEYATKMIRTYPKQDTFVFIERTHLRIDRFDWRYTYPSIVADMYADSHSIRPYNHPVNRPLIDKLVDEILGDEGKFSLIKTRQV